MGGADAAAPTKQPTSGSSSGDVADLESDPEASVFVLVASPAPASREPGAEHRDELDGFTTPVRDDTNHPAASGEPVADA